MKPILIFILGSCFLFSCGAKQNKTNKITERTIKLGEFVKSDPIDLFYKSPTDIKHYLDTCEKPWANQKAGTDYSFIGKEKETGEQFYGRYGKPTAMSDSAFAVFQTNYQPISAQEYILDRAKDEQVVIINEAHHKPKHRFFTRSLLKDLHNQGFRYLGLETLSHFDLLLIDKDINQRGYPFMKSGHYSKEPQFGNLIREALEIGYTLFPYEGEGNGKPREINQAKNIAAFMKDNKEGKYLILCGYAHATEGKMTNSWEKAMAGRLTEYTSINPLTVNQTKFDNRYDADYLNPLSQRLDLSEPTVFLDSNQLSYLGTRNDSSFDILVFHEQANYLKAKPDWLVENDNIWVSFSTDSISIEKPYLALAFLDGEEISEAIPYDLDVIENGKDSILLALKPGKYLLLLQNKLDSALTATLEVR